MTMPQYVEMSPITMQGQAEEDCLYPINPKQLPSISPYVQPHPLNYNQLQNILRPNFAIQTIYPFAESSVTSGTSTTRNSHSFAHPSDIPFSMSGSGCGSQQYCLQNLQYLQLQLHNAQLQHLRHAFLPR